MSFLRSIGVTRARVLLVVRYGLVGAVGAVVQVASFYIFISVLGFEAYYLAGSALSLVLALLTTFWLQKYWTFNDRSEEHTSFQFASYFAIALGNLALNLLLMRGAKAIVESLRLDFFSGWHVLAQAGIVLFVALLSFLANYFFTFRRRTQTVIVEEHGA